MVLIFIKFMEEKGFMVLIFIKFIEEKGFKTETEMGPRDSNWFIAV